MTAGKFICPQTAIKDDAHIRNAFLLKFICIQFVNITRACTPVDSPWWITRLILTHTKEIRSRSACARGNCTCIDARAARSDGNTTDACHWWEDEQSSLHFHADL